MFILTTKLRVSVEYSDIEYYCKSSAISKPFVFALEVNDQNKAVRGSLRKDRNPLYSLKKEELDNIHIILESNVAWIKSLLLSDDLLRLFIYNDANYRNMCSPPENLPELKADDYLIDFRVSSIGYLLPGMLPSNQLRISGITSKENLYQIKLSMTQIRN